MFQLNHFLQIPNGYLRLDDSHGKMLSLSGPRKYTDEDGVKHYEIYGPLFFGSVAAFNEKFDLSTDPEEVVIDFKESRIADMGGIEALNKLTERYHTTGKKLHLKHLSNDCVRLLRNAGDVIDVNIIEDPSYQVATEKGAGY